LLGEPRRDRVVVAADEPVPFGLCHVHADPFGIEKATQAGLGKQQRDGHCEQIRQRTIRQLVGANAASQSATRKPVGKQFDR